MLKNFRFMRKNDFAHLGRSADKLFQVDYRHVSGRSCADCDPTKQSLQLLENRLEEDPVIH